MLYVCWVPEQAEVLPEIVPGCAGAAAILTDNVRDALVPQELFATTAIVPPPVPAVTLIVLVMDVPLHPEGSVHVYEVAPETAETE